MNNSIFTFFFIYIVVTFIYNIPKEYILSNTDMVSYYRFKCNNLVTRIYFKIL